jgi:hypothetical protein
MDPKYVLDQIDTAISVVTEAANKYTYKVLSKASTDREEVQHVTGAVTTALSTIRRTTYGDTEYLRQANALIDRYNNTNNYVLQPMLGVLKALRRDVNAGYTRTIGEIVCGEVFSDFLDMAEHLLTQKYKDPAAVLAGGVLEEHLRKLCIKHGISTTKPNGEQKKLDAMNSELVAASIYNTTQQKSVTTFAGLRNDAAHGDFSKYTEDMVKGMIFGIRTFIATNVA